MSDLPPFVHPKVSKGHTYYYFVFDRGGDRLHVRLPDVADPGFADEVERLTQLRAKNELPQPRSFAPASGSKTAYTPSALPRHIYFMGGDEGPIKIGLAADPQKRLASIQLTCPFEIRVLALAHGNRTDELGYHRRFAAHKVRGEWFERCPEIEAEIARLNAENGS